MPHDTTKPKRLLGAGLEYSKGRCMSHSFLARRCCRYDQLATAFGGRGVKVDTPEELENALAEALRFPGPTLLNVTIDPQAGVESGNVHAFNFKAPEK